MLVTVLTVIIGFLPCVSLALDTGRDDVRAFINELAKKHDLDKGYVQTILAQSETKQKILDAISRPAEKTRPWHEYREIFITPKRIAAGKDFLTEHADRLARISAKTGVPAEIITAIIGVETFYGRITGGYRVIDALATLGFDYPPRAKFFSGQLEELFLLAQDEQLELTELIGSYAGAMGPPQFIPSSYRAYAVDGDGDGRRDLLNNWDDILLSVANYFIKNGWRTGEPVTVRGTSDKNFQIPTGKNSLKMTETVASLTKQGFVFATDLKAATPAQLISLEGKTDREYWIGFHNFYVITRYNRSAMYALAVFQLSAAISAADSGTTRPATTSPDPTPE
ncbi:MAG: lytic murein transglycosylase B [Chromatiales bacterium]|nr:lytic murein transglycosylase B [Chromatiales bacterium]